jgi:hypothetical protein
VKNKQPINCFRASTFASTTECVKRGKLARFNGPVNISSDNVRARAKEFLGRLDKRDGDRDSREQAVNQAFQLVSAPSQSADGKEQPAH